MSLSVKLEIISTVTKERALANWSHVSRLSSIQLENAMRCDGISQSR
jgi:hypothetical protein